MTCGPDGAWLHVRQGKGRKDRIVPAVVARGEGDAVSPVLTFAGEGLVKTAQVAITMRPDWTCDNCGRVWRHCLGASGGQWWLEVRGPVPGIGDSE